MIFLFWSYALFIYQSEYCLYFKYIISIINSDNNLKNSFLEIRSNKNFRNPKISIFFFLLLFRHFFALWNETDSDSSHKSGKYKIHHQFDDNAKKCLKSRKKKNIDILGFLKFLFDLISQKIFLRLLSEFMMDIMYLK